jgi:hypothetical protein
VNDGGNAFQVEDTGQRWGVQLPASATSLPSITFSMSRNAGVLIIGAAVLGSGCQVGQCPGESSSTVLMSVGVLCWGRHACCLGIHCFMARWWCYGVPCYNDGSRSIPGCNPCATCPAGYTSTSCTVTSDRQCLGR